MDDNKQIAELKSAGESSSREKIIAAACTEFAEHGLDGARVDHIAERAGVNKAMIYYHFQSKENLYEQVLHGFFDRAATLLKQRASDGKAPADFLRGVAEAHAQLNEAVPEFRRIMLRELANPREEIMEWIAQAIVGSGISTLAMQRFQAGVDAGEFRKIDGRQAMISFIMMSLGYFLMYPMMDRVWSVEDHAAFVEERKAAVVDLFLHGVMAK